jgi:hypothetical protein
VNTENRSGVIRCGCWRVGENRFAVEKALGEVLLVLLTWLILSVAIHESLNTYLA